ncbi:ornithine carbamoyltransferase [Halanaerobaculum tunisiense]
MQTVLRGKDFISLQDWSKEEVDTLLDVSFDLKRKFAMGIDTPYLQNKTAMLMFFEESTRTRNSMEAGLAQLGGHANFLDTSTMQVSHGEVAKDTGVILGSFGHAIACRNCFWEEGHGNEYLRSLAKHAPVPIMNLQCNLYHPMQGLADLMTIQEKKNITEELNVSIIWAYATSHKKPISVPVTQALLFPRYAMNVTVAHPEGFELPDWVLEQAEKNAKQHGGSFEVTNNMEEAYQNADVVIPKNWGSWVNHPDGGGNLLEANKDWKCTEEMMELAKDDVSYMHALPADRGNEVVDSVIDGSHSIVYDEAENRLHTAKSVMAVTMGGKG